MTSILGLPPLRLGLCLWEAVWLQEAVQPEESRGEGSGIALPRTCFPHLPLHLPPRNSDATPGPGSGVWVLGEPTVSPPMKVTRLRVPGPGAPRWRQGPEDSPRGLGMWGSGKGAGGRTCRSSSHTREKSQT